MSLFISVLLVVISLNAIALSLYYLLVAYPLQQAKIELDKLGWREVKIHDNHHHGPEADKQIHKKVTLAKGIKKLKRKQKIKICRLYWRIFAPISAGIIALA